MTRTEAIQFLRQILAPYEIEAERDWDAILELGFTVTDDGRYTQTRDQVELLHACLRHGYSGPISDVACPPWCDLPTGHRYDEDANGLLVRWHETSDQPSLRASVEVVQQESALAASGPIQLGSIGATVCIDGDVAGEQFTADECRAAAAALLAAAARLDAVELSSGSITN